MPTTIITNRKHGLMRQSMKMCIWLGSPDCYRNQDNVLCTPSQATSARYRADMALREGPPGRTYRNSTIAKSSDERQGTTPFNVLPFSTGGQPTAFKHPASTPYNLADWWCKYLLSKNGTLLDMFAGSGTCLQSGLENGAKSVIGIEKKKSYLTTTKKRIQNS